MMESNTIAATVLTDVIEGLSLYAPPPRGFFRDVLNECLTRLYTEVLLERAITDLRPNGRSVPLSDIPTLSGTPVRGEDILSVSLDGRGARYLSPDQLSVASEVDAPYYTLEGEQILLSREAKTLRVCFVLRPPLCTEENEATYRIPLFPEFMPLLTARLRGEGYRAANEDALAAKCLEEYNHRLDGFVSYLTLARAAKGARV